MDRPTPVHVKEKNQYRYSELSILKQCLHFEGKKKAAGPATVLIYKIAEDLDLYLSDFVDCMEDLCKMIDLLPA